jgi:hypothetical protein
VLAEPSVRQWFSATERATRPPPESLSICNSGLTPEAGAETALSVALCGINQVSSSVMGMTLRTSEQQTEALRRQAAAEGRSMQAVALSAIDEYIARRAHKAKVATALQRVVREEAGVLERLKDA